MNKKIRTYPTFRDAGDAAIAAVRGRKTELGVKHILIVPDKYTLYYERRLFSGGGAFDAEVLTLNRLFQRAGIPCGAYLSRQGAVMLLRGIVSENAARLGCFGRSAQFTGFAEKLYNVFTQLESSGLDPLTLSADGALGAKLADIRLLYSLYKERTAGRYVDAAGRLELLRRHADCPYVRGAHLYVTGYYGMTKQTRAVIDALGEAAASLSVFECEPSGAAGRVRGAEVYAASDAVSGIKAAARRINDLAYRGARYGDMCVVAVGSVAEIKRIFSEHGIPYFADSSGKLSARPLARYVLTAIDCAQRGYRRRDMIRLAKNPCAGVDRRDADAMENYCNARLVDYLGFFRPFGEAAAERARARIAASAGAFTQALKTAYGPAPFAAAVRGLLASAADDEAAGKIDNLLRQLESLLPERCPQRLVCECFSEGLDAATVGALPAYTDTVTVGAPEVFRGQTYGHVFILGFNDGELPAYAADEGLLSDAECGAIGGVEPTTAEINARAAEEIRQIALGAPDLFVTVTEGAARPSGVLAALLGEGCTFVSQAGENDALLYDGKDRARRTERYCADRASALELMITGARSGLPTAASIAAAVDGAEKYLNPPVADAETVDARGLFFKSGHVGVTELGCYFDCPRMHFYRYGLQLTARETGEMNGLDAGNFLHAAAERFAGLAQSEQTEAAARRIAGDIAQSEMKYGLKGNAPLTARLVDEAVRLCLVIKRQLEAGSYTSFAREAPFGPDERFPALPLETRAGTVLLCGKIDRVDVCDDYVRVIDYKTGSTKFSYAAVYYGRQLQLPLYMRSALSGVNADGGSRKAGGMFYFPFRARWSDDDGDLRLDGPFDCSPDSLAAHDGGYMREPRHTGTVVRVTAAIKDGELRPERPPATAVTSRFIESVGEYAVRAAAQAADEIAAGYAAPVPFAAGGKTVCRYCDYRDMCRKAYPRYSGTPGKEVFGDAVE